MSISHPVSEATRGVAMSRLEAGALRETRDLVACEEPLEIQVNGTSLAVLMRTPGNDRELVLGFLVTERIADEPGDITSIHHDSVAKNPATDGNVIRVNLRPDLQVDLTSHQRNLYSGSSCGICGKASIEQAMGAARPLDDTARFASRLFHDLPGRLREAQAVFEETGGLHAAALVSPDGALRIVREDVGRHNAVDKVVGWALENALVPLAGHVLLVSGRISYEIVQKALAARIPVVAAVSAPSSLAVELAEASRMALVGFLRAGGFNLYAQRSRILA